MSSSRAYPFAPTPAAQAAMVAEEARMSKPILLVDDDPTILELGLFSETQDIVFVTKTKTKEKGKYNV